MNVSHCKRRDDACEIIDCEERCGAKYHQCKVRNLCVWGGIIDCEERCGAMLEICVCWVKLLTVRRGVELNIINARLEICVYGV